MSERLSADCVRADPEQRAILAAAEALHKAVCFNVPCPHQMDAFLMRARIAVHAAAPILMAVPNELADLADKGLLAEVERLRGAYIELHAEYAAHRRCWEMNWKDRALKAESEVALLRAEIERLRHALAWVLINDYGDSIIPPRAIADTMAAVAHNDGSVPPG